MLRAIPPDVQTTHWPDGLDQIGCWSHHRQCAIARVAELERERNALEAEVSRLRASVRHLSELLTGYDDDDYERAATEGNDAQEP